VTAGVGGDIFSLYSTDSAETELEDGADEERYSMPVQKSARDQQDSA
jgi:hypothetical protein